MNKRKSEAYSDSPAVWRNMHVGGMSKSELTRRLNELRIAMNAYAEQLFADERFTTSDVRRTLLTAELSVAELGLPDGARLPQIFEKASELGLNLCPLELAPHLRMQYTEQADGGSLSVPGQNQAPEGSITIASEPLTDDHEFPKGFYLRSIEGTLWLRGYRCDFEHVWQAEDRFVFVKGE